MARRKKKTRSRSRRRRGSGLNGPPATGGKGELTLKDSILPAAIASVVGVGAAGIGAGLGPFSIPLGLASVFYGIKRNDKHTKFLLAAGIGLLAGTSVKRVVDDAQTETVEGLDGFSLKNMMGNSKAYFLSFADKFSLPIGDATEESIPAQEQTTTSGLNGDVTYFINPYSTNQNNQLDLSELDKIQQQVREMKAADSGVGDIEPGMRNF